MYTSAALAWLAAESPWSSRAIIIEPRTLPDARKETCVRQEMNEPAPPEHVRHLRHGRRIQ